MIYKQEAIIINFRDLGEADKIVTLLSRNKGRIDSVAKGVRKPNSRKSASIDIANRGLFSLATGKTLDVITEVKLLENYQHIKISVITIAAVSYVLDLVDRFYAEPGQGDEIYSVLVNFLESLNSITDNNLILNNLVLGFEIKLLDISGFLQTPLKENSNNKEQQRVYKIIQFMKQANFEHLTKLKTNNKDINIIDNYLYNQILNVLEKDLKSYQFLKKVLHD